MTLLGVVLVKTWRAATPKPVLKVLLLHTETLPNLIPIFFFFFL
jgi:hypothetical protein